MQIMNVCQELFFNFQMNLFIYDFCPNGI